MPKTMTTPNLGHRSPDARFVRVDVALGRVHVGVAGENVEGERVHVFRPTGEAGVAERVKNERLNTAGFDGGGVLLLQCRGFDVTTGAGKIQSVVEVPLRVSRTP